MKVLTHIRRNYIILSVLLLAIVLRIYNIQNRFIFDGEKGDNYLRIIQFLTQNGIPLLGPPTSHTWLSFPPLYYYLFAPFLIITFSPYLYAFFGILIGVLTIISSYIYIQKLFNKPIAQLLAFLMSCSPIFIDFSLGARFFSIILIFIPPFLYLFYNFVTGKHKNSFILGVLFGIMLNFHYTVIMLLPFMLTTLLLKRPKINILDILKAGLGVILAITPYLIYDSMHFFSMSQNIILWIPYKLIYFSKNIGSLSQAHDTLSFISFMSYEVSLKNEVIGIIFIIFITTMTIYKAFRKTLSFKIYFVLLWFLLGLLSILIHGQGPLHYYVPILIAPLLLLSIMLNDLRRIKSGTLLTIVILIFVMACGILSIFKTTNPYNSIPEQYKISRAILHDSNGDKYSLRRVGESDEFEYDYAQNYIYILWYMGNMPIQTAQTRYTIYEGRKYVPKEQKDVIYRSSDVLVIKND